MNEILSIIPNYLEAHDFMFNFECGNRGSLFNLHLKVLSLTIV